jgi:hypothetical protein
MLDVRRMQVLRAVISSGSISAAARNLGYTPSAISQQLAALEREVGAKLLERLGAASGRHPPARCCPSTPRWSALSSPRPKPSSPT